MQFCKHCGCLMTLGICRNREAHDPTFKKRTWVIGGREHKFEHAVTFKEAEKLSNLKKSKGRLNNEFN